MTKQQRVRIPHPFLRQNDRSGLLIFPHMPAQPLKFGQRQKLTTRLRELVRKYPKGVGLFKEFLQNADDAGASRLEAILDLRTHPKDRLPNGPMSCLQGRALIFLNDQVFTGEDWEKIQDIGNSGKAMDTAKTGRFGLGFNCVYNVTDYPMLLTGRHLGIFDPHVSTIAGATHVDPGAAWTLEALWEDFADLLTPFLGFGLHEGQTQFDGTIFRLPLRDQRMAQRSEICNEAYKSEDFQQMVQSVEEHAGNLILFLNSVRDFKLSKIAANGDRSDYVSVETTNGDDIATTQTAIHEQVSLPVEETLSTLASFGDQTWFTEHELHIATRSATRIERWARVRGLYSHDDLIATARHMCDFNEKAIPLAGAALLLNGESRNGVLSCCLPLPTTSGTPLHIDGYFDLQDSRQDIFQDGFASGKRSKTRVRWNELLLKHACAQAAAELLARVAALTGTPNYKCWPAINTSGTTDRLVVALPESIYESLLTKQCIFAGSAQALSRPDEVTLVDDTIYAPLLADGLPLPNPKLPTHVILGFSTSSAPLSEMTPASLRDWLRDDRFSSAVYTKCQRRCLTKREWLFALLKYCLSDKQYVAFVNVPLALMSDDLLRHFDQSDATYIYLGTESEKSLLRRIPNLFLDDDAAKLAVKQLPNVSTLGLAGLIEQLPHLFHTLSEGRSVEYVVNRDDLPSYEWLAEFYNHCCESAHEKQNRSLSSHALAQLPLVPDTNGRLWAMGWDSTPVYLDSAKQLRWLLTLLEAGNIPVVAAKGDVGKAIARFKSAFGNNEIVSLTPDWLVEAAAANFKVVEVLKTDSDIAAKFLQFVASNELTFSAMQSLPQLPVFPLVGGGTTALHDDIYQSTGFVPPGISTGVALLSAADSQLKRLYDKLKVRELTQARFVLDFVLDGFEGMSEDDQFQALSWLKDNYFGIVRSIPEDKRSRFADKIRTTPLIDCGDDELHSASEIYHPECKDVFSLLGSAGHSPDLDLYPSEDWLEFFGTLGMERHVRPSDLIRAIDNLSDGPLTASVATRSHHLMQFIQRNWLELQGQDVAGIQFSEALSRRQWLPPISTRPSQVPENLFHQPEARLYSPCELACREDLDLVSSVLPVCRYPIPVPIACAIGHNATTAQTVLAHFDNVIEACAQYEAAGEHEARMLQKVYEYIGQVLAQSPSAITEPELAEKYGDAYCLIDGELKLWTPAQAFRVAVPYFLHLRRQIRFKSEASERCLDALGRKQSPTADDFRAFLASYRSGLDTDTVPESDREQICDAYLHAGRVCNANELSSSLVLSSDGRLRPTNDVLVDDAPWLSERAAKSGVEFLHKDLGAKVAIVFGVGQLSQVISERVENIVECENSDLLVACDTLNQKIRAPQFVNGLLRLLPFDTEVESELESLRQFEVVPAASIHTVLCWDGEEIQGSVGETEFVSEGNYLYITDMPESVLRIQIADAITKRVFIGHAFSNESYISLMLAEAANAIDGVLTRLRVPNLPEGRAVSALESDDNEYVDSSTKIDSTVEASARPRQPSQQSGGLSQASQATPATRYDSTNQGTTPVRNENEPPQVRSGAKTQRSVERPRAHRAVTYVASADSERLGGASHDAKKRSAVDTAAIQQVERFERRHRDPVVMPQLNKGYDLESRRKPSGEIERYIEVKGLGGAWNDFGVKLTPAQMQFGLQKGSLFWLYIVEFALDPDRSVIHMICDPVSKITDYRFDAGWKQLIAESSDAQLNVPEIGRWVQMGEDGRGIIVDLQKHGELMRLTIQLGDGRKVKRNFPNKDITVVEE